MKNVFSRLWVIGFSIGISLMLPFSFCYADSEPLDSTSIGPNNTTSAPSGEVLLWYATGIEVVMQDQTTANKDDTCVVAMNGSNPAQCGPGLTPQVYCSIVGISRMGSGDYNLSVITTIHPACIDNTYKGGYRVAVNGYGLGDKGSSTYRGVTYACTITCVTSPVFNTFCQPGFNHQVTCIK